MIKITQRITWQEPDEITVTQVEISRSNTLYGVYSVIDTIYSTDDENPKDSTNAWVTLYTDITGLRTHWYKIRFYDGTNYSDYADSTTSEELIRLCSVDDVKRHLDVVGRWSDDVIFEAITEVDDIIYIECGTPLQAVYSDINRINAIVQNRYYVGEEDIYRVDRVFYGTTTKSELFLDDGYRVNTRYGMVEILPYASSGIDLTSGNATQSEIEMQYVPSIFHKLSLYRTMLKLLEELDTTSGGTMSKEVEVARSKSDRIETLLHHRVALQMSGDVQYYDKVYGVNRKKIRQNHDRNNYIGSYGW